MTEIQRATPKAKPYFINDYLTRYGSLEELAEQYADACIYTNQSLVVTKDEKIIGGITWSIKEGINSGLVEIFQMSILQNYRGHGYGSILVENCLEDIEQFYQSKNYPLRRIYIIITESNIIGRNLYRNKGFYVTASLLNHRFYGQSDLFYVKDYFSK